MEVSSCVAQTIAAIWERLLLQDDVLYFRYEDQSTLRLVTLPSDAPCFQSIPWTKIYLKILNYFHSNPSLHLSLHDTPLPSLRVYTLTLNPHILYTCTIPIPQNRHSLHYLVFYCLWVFFHRATKALNIVCPH